eukprot:gene10273-12600_t
MEDYSDDDSNSGSFYSVGSSDNDFSDSNSFISPVSSPVITPQPPPPPQRVTPPTYTPPPPVPKPYINYPAIRNKLVVKGWIDLLKSDENEKQILRVPQNPVLVPNFKLTGDIKDILKSTPLPKKIEGALNSDRERNLYFVNNASRLRPYLNMQARPKNIPDLNQYPSNLSPFIPNRYDPIHNPFTQYEIDTIISYGVSSSTPISSLEKICSTDLPGRTPIDCLRFLSDLKKIEETDIEIEPTIETNITINDLLPKKSQKISKLLMKREFNPKERIKIDQKTIMSQKLKNFVMVDQFSTSGSPIIDCKFDPTDKTSKILILSTASPKEAVFYDYKKKSIENLSYHKDECSEGHFTKDGKKAITGGADGSIVIWDTATGAKMNHYNIPNDSVLRLTHHPEFPILAAGFKQKSLLVVNHDVNVSINLSSICKEWPGPITDISFGSGPNYNLLASSIGSETPGVSGYTSIIDIFNYEETQKISKQNGDIESLAWNPRDSNILAIGSTDKNLSIITYDLRANNIVSKFPTKQDEINRVTFSPCGRFYTSSGNLNSTFVFDNRVPDRTLQVLKHDYVESLMSSNVHGAVWSNQGRFLVTCGDDAKVKIWDVSSCQPLLATLSDHKTAVNFVDISLCSDMIVSAGDDVGYKYFWKYKFKCNRFTLIPRPDSETLIEQILEIYSNEKEPKTILDFGTGTGCLLLCTLKEFPNSIGYGIDQSKEALEISQENSIELGLTKRCSFIQANWNDSKSISNFLEKTNNPKFDLIISNPPYISPNEFQTLNDTVTKWEPKSALIANNNGLEDYENLSKLIRDRDLLTENGKIIFEIGKGQEKDIENIMIGNDFQLVQVKSDLTSIIRSMVFKRRSPPTI